MIAEPLYIRFANGQITSKGVIESFLKNAQNDKTRDIAEKALESPPNLTQFRKDFKSLLSDLMDRGVNREFVNYLNSYMKPSLEEFVEGSSIGRTGEKRWVGIKDEETPWVEAAICYNLSLYIKLEGIEKIKQCPVCKKFFCHKTKYAKYCSDSCKTRGS
jgi:hypothetical protein